jgi:hypothetical protein
MSHARLLSPSGTLQKIAREAAKAGKKRLKAAKRDARKIARKAFR